MMTLSAEKSEQVARLFAVAPDSALNKLASLLATALRTDPTLEPVHAIASAEAELRRVVTSVFEPLIPLTWARAGRSAIRRSELADLWRRIKARDGALAERAIASVRMRSDDSEIPPEFDEVCRRAAELSEDATLARWLRLAPVLRGVQARVGDWTRNLSGESVAGVRLAFKDALAIDEDGGPAFWEAVMAMLGEPHRVVRLISAAIDRPSDRYLASSELAHLGEGLLNDVDERIAAVKAFDPMSGCASAAAAAESVATAGQTVGEFEEWLSLAKDGPWGQRIANQKRALAQAMESRLREVEPAVAAALPTQPVRGAGRSVRPVPKLSADPSPIVVARAEALLTLMNESRSSASAGGFASARAKLIESLEKRLDQYCEDLLDALRHGGADDEDRVRAFLDIAARFTGLVRGEENAQIVRRRAAAT